jgi:Zn-finger nucleic acid-binding protein
MSDSCPVCRISLRDREFLNISFRECPQCAGIWLFKEALSSIQNEDARNLAVMESMASGIPSAKPSVVRECPSCGLAMERFRYLIHTPIALDRCNSCKGLWIDDGELMQMAEALTQEVQQPAGIDCDPELEARKRVTIALFTTQHEREMARYHAMAILTGLFSHHYYAVESF